MQNVVYSKQVPAGMLMKTLAGFVSLLTLCVVIQNSFLTVFLASALAFVLVLGIIEVYRYK